MESAKHSNNLGFLRLMLAVLVIVSHAQEILDGNRNHELLARIVGSRSFGDVAVDGFFLLSGYLILQSYSRSASVVGYLSKRIRRIYPGYLAVYAVCVFVIAPLTGLRWSELSLVDYVRMAVNAVSLQGPHVPGFIGMPYEVLNGSL